jgi:ribulose 1,5-bisphosphate carboxylase large subunit-like protein
MRQALDAALKGVALGDYAEKHKELKVALETWPNA